MGFTNLDDLIAELTASTPKSRFRHFQKIRPNTAGVAAVWESWWAMGGDPQAGDLSGAALTAAQCTESTTGAVDHGGNVTPDTKHLAAVGVMASGSLLPPGQLIVLDRLLYYPGIDAAIATSQALVNGVALPRYTDGKGVRAFLEVTTALGTGTGVLTYGASGYTNSAGTTGRQHGVTVNTTASAAANRLPHSGAAQNNNWNPFLPLQAGDVGLRSVESIRFTSAHSAGVCALVLAYPLVTIPIPDVNVLCERDLLFQIPSLPRVYDGACLMGLFVGNGALNANSYLLGHMEFVWG